MFKDTGLMSRIQMYASTRAAELELELELELILLPELELELELKFQAGTVISSGLPLK